MYNIDQCFKCGDEFLRGSEHVCAQDLDKACENLAKKIIKTDLVSNALQNMIENTKRTKEINIKLDKIYSLVDEIRAELKVLEVK